MPSADVLEYKSLVLPFVVGQNYGVLQKRKVPIRIPIGFVRKGKNYSPAGVKRYAEYKIAKDSKTKWHASCIWIWKNFHPAGMHARVANVVAHHEKLLTQ